jgi:L,D-transpeptidase ErfK/SrfK
MVRDPKMLRRSRLRWLMIGALALVLVRTTSVFAGRWSEAAFDTHQLVAAPIPVGSDSIIGEPLVFTVEKGDTLLDIGRWYGLSAREISDANHHIDWWAPPPGEVVLPTERILPEGPHTGIILNIPEMRIYYFYPPAVGRVHRRLRRAAYVTSPARVVYTFPVGLGRYDWKTPVSAWRVTGKLVNPTWVVPQDIYEEHLERDGEAEHVVPGGDPENPLGHFKLVLSLPEYGIHGTDVPWGVGMNVSHGCIRLYPENIEQLYKMTPVGTPGRFVYQPVKFGWREGALYVEVHDDLYSVYPGLWNHALHEVKRLHLENSVDLHKLEQAVEAKTGLPTFVMPGAMAPTPLEAASAVASPPSAPLEATSDVSPPVDTGAISAPDDSGRTTPASAGDSNVDTGPAAPSVETESPDGNWVPLPPSRIINDKSIE